MINTRVYIYMRPRSEIAATSCCTWRNASRQRKRERKADEKRRRIGWIERTVCARVEARSDNEEKESERDRKKSIREPEKRNDEARFGVRGVRADGGEEGKREAREGGGMLRSRGNRLPSERAARSPLLSFPSITFAAAPAGSLSLLYHSGHAVPVASLSVVFECHAASRSIARAPRGPSDSFFSLSLSLFSSSLAFARTLESS